MLILIAMQFSLKPVGVCINLIWAVVALVVYDVLFFLFHRGFNLESGIYVTMMYVLNIAGFVFKIVLIIALIVLKVKCEDMLIRAELEKSNS